MKSIRTAVNDIVRHESLGVQDGWALVQAGYSLKSSATAAQTASKIFVDAGNGPDFKIRGKAITLTTGAENMLATWYDQALKPHTLKQSHSTGLAFGDRLKGGAQVALAAKGQMIDAFLASDELRGIIDPNGDIKGAPTDQQKKDFFGTLHYLVIGGTARADATISFKMLDTDVSADVKKGDTNAEVATKIAAAINAARDKVQAAKLASDVDFTQDDAMVHGPLAVAVGGTVAMLGEVYD